MHNRQQKTGAGILSIIHQKQTNKQKHEDVSTLEDWSILLFLIPLNVCLVSVNA